MLLNTTSHGGEDAAFWLEEPPQNGFGYTMLGGAHFQEQRDIDGDGWANVPSYRRLDLRPRLFWDNGKGRSVFATFGAMTEDQGRDHSQCHSTGWSSLSGRTCY